MLKGYKTISTIWKNFPEELKSTTLPETLTKLEEEFKSKRMYFDEYLSKIIIIGNVSSGKSTLINRLLNRNLFEVTESHSTVAYFYVKITDKEYEYFTINDGPHIRDFKMLGNATKCEEKLKNYIDENSKFKVNIEGKDNFFLNNSTIIVDCPGLFQEKQSKEQILKNCKNSDIIIYMVDAKAELTEKENTLLNEILSDSRRPTCFYVYNKCDTIDLNKNIETLKENFYKITGYNSQSIREPIYFIANKNENIICKGEFERLEKQLMDIKIKKYLGLNKLFGNLSVHINIFMKMLAFLINELERDKKLKKTEMELSSENIEKLKELQSSITNDIKKAESLSLNCLKERKIANSIQIEIHQNEETCTKQTAKTYIIKMADSIDNYIKIQLQDIIDRYFYNHIKLALENTPMNDKLDINEFKLDSYIKFAPIDVDLKIFGFWEKGTKTTKVKNCYTKYIKNKETDINNSINQSFESEMSRFADVVEMKVKNMLQLEEETLKSSTKLCSSKYEMLTQVFHPYKENCDKLVKNYEEILNEFYNILN